MLGSIIHQSCHSSRSPTLSSSSQLKYGCDWKECRLEFDTQCDLVLHVNEMHVRLNWRNPMEKAHKCHWFNCNFYLRFHTYFYFIYIYIYTYTHIYIYIYMFQSNLNLYSFHLIEFMIFNYSND